MMEGNGANKDDNKSLNSMLTDDPRFQYDGEMPKKPPAYSNWFQFAMYIVAITAGLLQGYQIGIIAGIELYLPEEYKGIKIQEDGSETTGDNVTTTKDREFFVSFYALGAAFGAFFGGQLCDSFGRRNMAIFGDIVIALGFVVVIMTDAIKFGWIGRVVCGLGSGVQSFAIPLYLNEVANPRWNKVVCAFFTLFTGVGMLSGLNLAIPYRHHWKALFEWGFIPVGLQILVMVFLPESQSYYINKGRMEDGLKVLKKGMDDDDAELELEKLKYEK
jgi:MFS family permease